MEFGEWLTCPHAGLGTLIPYGRAGSEPCEAHLKAKFTVSLERFKIVRYEGWVRKARRITQAIHFPAILC